ncbi:hypothetical protein FD754_016781 [Muntiacus muntjak]|uniref:Uncharacterized protein n=1 Tax=Muntiacus muntjak TaxID=9888 RepID=A0A5N3VRZ5_MUNMU|nr:hypothetical protein FD754_016781 [Muntiacus muntjak]
MSAKAIESWEGGALGHLLRELLSEEEEEPSQSSNQASDGSSLWKPPQRPYQGADGFGSYPRDPPQSEGSNFYHYAGMTAAAVVGGVMAVRAVPELLDTMGFTKTGISRSSFAANMMSSTARANGGRVPSGSLVSNLQSKELNSLAPSETAQNLQGQTGLPTMGLPRGWSAQNTHFLRPTGCLALDPVPGSVCVNLALATSLPMWITDNRFWKTCFHLNMSL